MNFYNRTLPRIKFFAARMFKNGGVGLNKNLENFLSVFHSVSEPEPPGAVLFLLELEPEPKNYAIFGSGSRKFHINGLFTIIYLKNNLNFPSAIIILNN